MRVTPRALLRLLAMILWLAFCATIHILTRRRPSPGDLGEVSPKATEGVWRSPWPRRLLRGIGWIAGARVTTRGTKPTPQTLIIANHVSWLDIPVLAGATDCAFVAKDGLKGHPFMRWLCEQNGTVFVDRDRRATIADQLAEMEAALRSHKPLCLFPEGTVGDGGKLLPFRPALFKIAEGGSASRTIQPVAIDYGEAAQEFGWPQGEAGKANFLRLLGRPGSVAVTLHFLEPLAAGQDRKAIAQASQAAVERTLGTTGP